MRDDLWENTALTDKTFPINVFHNKGRNGVIMKWHWHEHFELIYMERGSAVFQVGGTGYPVTEGELLFVNSGELHGGHTEDADEVRFVCVVFHPSLLHIRNHDRHALELLTPLTSGSRQIETRIPVSSSDYPKISNALKELIREFAEKADGYEVSVKACAGLLLSWLSRSYSKERRGSGTTEGLREKNERFQELLTSLEGRYSEKWTVEQAAALVHLSPYHFCKVFKRLTGFSFVQFLTLHRIQESERLLKETELSVTEIAEMAGYGSINAFSKVFKSYKGCPPTALRNVQSPRGPTR